jgi:hypothetical protein
MRRMACIFCLYGLSACQLAGDQRSGSDYASWSVVNQDGSWTFAAEAAVRATSLSRSLPGDIEAFCAAYPDRNDDSRVKFWVALVSAIAEFESDLKPQTQFTETLRDTEGQRVVSRGLLQISIESANQERYACRIQAPNDLHNPTTNIRCGVKILAHWVQSDGVIAASGRDYKGGARYWSVLRSKNPSSADIKKITRGLEFCQA